MENQSYKAIVNGQFEFTDLASEKLDVVVLGDSTFHILKNRKAYHAEIVDKNAPNKTITLKINGSTYEVKLEDSYDQLIKKLGLSKQVQYKVKDIKAPMPGLVLSVQVEPGQAVQKGDALLILEAMKMENVIKSPGEGVVKTIHVTQGAAVEKGLILLEME